MIEVSISLSEQLTEFFGEGINVSDSGPGMVTIQVPVDDWFEVAQTLRDDPRFLFQ